MTGIPHPDEPAQRFNRDDRFHHPFTQTDAEALAWTKTIGKLREQYDASPEKAGGMNFQEYTGRALLEWFGDA